MKTLISDFTLLLDNNVQILLYNLPVFENLPPDKTIVLILKQL